MDNELPKLKKNPYSIIYLPETVKSVTNDQIKKFTEIIANEFKLNKIPEDVGISTTTVNCEIKDFKFNCDNIAKYINLSLDRIVDVRKDDGHTAADAENILIHRTLISKKRRKNKKKVFFNQVSLYVFSKFKKNGYNHIKLFANGSIHITGCQSTEDVVNLLLIVMEELRIIKAVINQGKIEEKPFVSDIARASISSIENFKVAMINTNFKVNFEIALNKLDLLLKNKVESHLDRMRHSAVNIHFFHLERKITILVFSTGSLVVTGAQNGEQILAAYNFINGFLYENYTKILIR